MDYRYEDHGFVIVKNFFNPAECEKIKMLARARVEAKKQGGQTFSNIMSISDYDPFEAQDFRQDTPLKRIGLEIVRQTYADLSFFNSIYLELHGRDTDSKKGFDWHQDVGSFCFLEKGTKALFCWVILENTLSDQGSQLEFILRADANKHLGVDLNERCVTVRSTAELKKIGQDLTSRGRYVLLDATEGKVLRFFDTPLESLAVSPEIKMGDLVICNKDVMHRTGPTSSKTGSRIAVTLRFVDPNAIYNGCFDAGINVLLWNIFESSSLWQRLVKERRGAKICG